MPDKKMRGQDARNIEAAPAAPAFKNAHDEIDMREERIERAAAKRAMEAICKPESDCYMRKPSGYDV